MNLNNIVARLRSTVVATFDDMSLEQQEQYLEDHPNSKKKPNADKSQPAKEEQPAKDDAGSSASDVASKSPALSGVLEGVIKNPKQLLAGGAFSKDIQKQYFEDLGYSEEEFDNFSTLLEGHTRDATQERADKEIAAKLDSDSRFGQFLRDRIKAELEFVKVGAQAADAWYEQKAKELKDTFEHDRKNGYSMYDPEYDGTPEQYLESNGMRDLRNSRDALKNPKFYRQGGATKDVLSTSRDSTGAKTSWMSKDSGGSIDPDNEWTFDEMLEKGYVPIAGYSSLFGYVGEDEVTFVKRPSKL